MDGPKCDSIPRSDIGASIGSNIARQIGARLVQYVTAALARMLYRAVVVSGATDEHKDCLLMAVSERTQR